MKAIIDTSALLSLSMVGILEDSLKIIEAYTTNQIKSELEELSKYRDQEANAALKLLNFIKNNKIKIINIDNSKIEELTKSDVDSGEASCMVACVENKIQLLIIDDADAIYELESLASEKEIKLKLSVAVIVDLLRKKLIAKNKAKSAINKLISTRRWEGGVLEVLIKRYLKGI